MGGTEQPAKAALLCAGMLAVLGLGCKGESVEARVVWVDGVSDGQARRIHVYDRGDRYTLEVFGETEPRESIELGSRGRGLFVRGGDWGAVWFDLDDGRRLPLPLSEFELEGPEVQFTARNDALWWRDEAAGILTVVPLAAGLALERDEDGSVRPLTEPGPLAWAIGASRAPILLTQHDDDARVQFLRYPDDAHDVLALVSEAEIEFDVGLSPPEEMHECYSEQCYARIAIDPDGELALAWDGNGYTEFDRRAPELAGELTLSAIPSDVRLLALLDRHVSVWHGPGFLYRWDRRTGRVDAEPLFATPPLHWFSVEGGRAVVLLSQSGPMYRVDREQLAIVNLETTMCAPIDEPVVAPSGHFAAWTCRDESFESPTTSGVIVRVSSEGIERHVGIAMATLAIDDAGDLLVYSVESTLTDVVDGVAATARPRSLFAISHAGTITRIDEFEPAPAPIMVGEFATYLQAAAID